MISMGSIATQNETPCDTAKAPAGLKHVASFAVWSSVIW
jgi:hypothetical protein